MKTALIVLRRVREQVTNEDVALVLGALSVFVELDVDFVFYMLDDLEERERERAKGVQRSWY
jgi:hypothetical protein